MNLKDYGLEFPKEKTVEALYDYIFKLVEVLDVMLSDKQENDTEV